jgi:hypothetical protein
MGQCNLANTLVVLHQHKYWQPSKEAVQICKGHGILV